ncbi:MAG: ATP-binding protein [Methanobrevibacter sp.]|nr:ATP-binding protein [Methanobrevibacter sp.]
MNSIVLEPKINELDTLNEFIIKELSKEDFQVTLIVEEIFVNIVHYSNTEFIIVNVKYEKPTLTIEFIDNGFEFNPLLKEHDGPPYAINETQLGGAGIYLTREMVDKIEYHYENNENHLMIIKNVE